MLNYARQRAIDALKIPRKAVLATNGPAGLQAGEFPCQAAGLSVYLLLPGTSDHLFNLEHDPHVALLTAGWELKGKAQRITAGEMDYGSSLMQEPGAEWCVLVRVDPHQIQIRADKRWGNVETFDLEGD